MATRRAKALYAVLFGLALPLLLVGWAVTAERSVAIPRVHAPALGALAAAAGLAMMVLGMAALWTEGGGLPMNIAPPPRLVTGGIYRLFAHPIYIGFALVCAGASIALGSASGLFLVTPSVMLCAAALVLGYEEQDLKSRFGPAPPLLLRLAPNDDARPSPGERAFAYTHVLLAWVVLYGAIGAVTMPDARSAMLPFETSFRVLPSTEILYASLYAGVLVAPMLTATRRELRMFCVRALFAMALVFPLYLALPFTAPPRPFEASGVFADLLRFERALDTPGESFPSFHVIWAWLAADAIAGHRPLARVVMRVWALLVALSCITTGMHALVDVAAGFLVLWLLVRAAAIWGSIQKTAERIANSWREWSVGPVRIINHGGWAALGTFVGLSVVGMLMGGRLAAALIAALAGLVGAALWAQIIEGSPRLLRPYGYYGGLLGACAGALLAPLVGTAVWLVLGAYAVAGPFIQAAGRLRCLVQGCCHGAPAPSGVGIRYVHPRSRVCRLSDLGGVHVHPTQVYSILWNGVIALTTARLWSLHAGLHVVGGVYLILNGAGRFVEEAYRGEPQTPVYGRLRLYQWVAIGSVVAGALVTALGRGAPAPTPSVHLSSIACGLAFGLLTWFALGVDFPRSSARFSRLV